MKTVIKLTQELVIGEIESILRTYPYSPYQQVFEISDLRQELIVFVMNRIPGINPTISQDQMLLVVNKEEDGDNRLFNRHLSGNFLAQQLHLQNLVHQGVFAIIQAKADVISHILNEPVHPGCEPSNWFG